MEWLVDGYNVIRRDPDLRGAEQQGLAQARAALLRLVTVAVQRSGDRFTVVFDGERRGRGVAPSRGPIEIRFSRPPQSADDMLVAEARRLRQGAIVVTSDRTVQDAARRAGATAVPAEGFIAALERPADEQLGRTDAGDGDADDGEPDDHGAGAPKAGNARRLSKQDRAVQRALGRLRRARR
jgi:predicted RNA-binding protein with PIN domain